MNQIHAIATISQEVKQQISLDGYQVLLKIRSLRLMELRTQSTRVSWLKFSETMSLLTISPTSLMLKFLISLVASGHMLTPTIMVKLKEENLELSFSKLLMLTEMVGSQRERSLN